MNKNKISKKMKLFEKLDSNNIFKYATSELSQDAFICYLLSFALEENNNINNQLTKVAFKFLNKIREGAIKNGKKVFEKDSYVSEIRQQYKNIDILVRIDDVYIIIEDKTFTSTHNNQINRYTEKLVEDDKIPLENIICVYYKIIEQPFREGNVDFEFDRKKLLELFLHANVKNTIFNDYVSYLQFIDYRICCKIYDIPLDKYDYFNNLGFFEYLKNKVKNFWGYGSISNAKGGFEGLWYGGYDLEVENLKKYTLYFQIENDLINKTFAIALKVGIETNENISIENYKEQIRQLNEKVITYFKENEMFQKNVKIEDFKKSKFRLGNSMTLFSIEYNKKDILDKIDILQNILDDYIKNFIN